MFSRLAWGPDQAFVLRGGLGLPNAVCNKGVCNSVVAIGPCPLPRDLRSVVPETIS